MRGREDVRRQREAARQEKQEAWKSVEERPFLYHIGCMIDDVLYPRLRMYMGTRGVARARGEGRLRSREAQVCVRF